MRVVLALALVCVGLLGVNSVFAQAPTLITQWGSFGNGPGQFNHPEGIGLDGQGHVLVADSYNYRVQEFSMSGMFVLQWGSYGSGDGQFGYPSGIVADALGNIYVSENGARSRDQRIQKFSSSGAFIAKWGTYGAGSAQLYFPSGMAFDAHGVLYVADLGNQRVVKYSQDGTYLGQWGGASVFTTPTDVAVDSHGFVYVVDNQRIKKFTSDGNYVATFGHYYGDAGPGGLGSARGCAVDSHDNLYVTDTTRQKVLIFSSSGTPLTEWGSQGSGPGQFSHPYGIRIDAANNIYVLDTENNRVQVFGAAPTPAKPTTWGAVKATYR